MPRRGNSYVRKAKHHRPGRGLSSRARAARRPVPELGSKDGAAGARPRFADSRRRGDDPADRGSVPATVVCPKGKIGFVHKDDARDKLAEHQNSTNPRRPIRIYRCRDCDAWHLTSQEWRGPRDPSAGAPDPPAAPSQLEDG